MKSKVPIKARSSKSKLPYSPIVTKSSNRLKFDSPGYRPTDLIPRDRVTPLVSSAQGGSRTVGLAALAKPKAKPSVASVIVRPKEAKERLKSLIVKESDVVKDTLEKVRPLLDKKRKRA